MSNPIIDALGKPCPMPVILTKQALDGGAAEVTVLVDNETAVENLKRLAESRGGTARAVPQEGHFAVTVTGTGDAPAPQCPAEGCALPATGGTAYLIGRDHLGEGDPALGGTLMKMFLYTLGQGGDLPRSLVFLNGGVRLPAGEEEQVISSLRELEEKGSRVLVCGTCLNYYGLTGALKVGTVSNMYDIVEELQRALKVVTV